MADTGTHSTPASANSAAPRWFYFVVTFAILLGLVRLGRELLIPLVVATLLFILSAAVTERIESASIGGWKPPKWLARLVSIALVFLGFLAVGTVMSNQAEAISEAGPRYAARLEVLVSQARDLVGTEITSAVQRGIAGVDVGAWLSGTIKSVSGILGTVVLILLYVAFMMAERRAFREKLPRLCAGEAEADHLSSVLRSISTGVQHYMWISTLTSAMSATVAFVVLKLVGVDFAVTLALIVFLVNFIPSIGSILGVSVTSLVALLQFDTLTPFFIVLVAYGGADTIIGNLIAPALQGKSLNLSSFMVMVFLAFWGIMWGPVGAFLAVPMMVVTMIICAEVRQLRPFAVLLSGDGQITRANRGES